MNDHISREQAEGLLDMIRSLQWRLHKAGLDTSTGCNVRLPDWMLVVLSRPIDAEGSNGIDMNKS